MLPKRLDRKKIYESRWINLYVDKVQMPSGKVIEEYHQLDYPNEAAVMLLTNSNNKICFIRSLRYTTQRIEWELPCGSTEKGEDVLAAASREIFEETGYQAADLKVVYSYYPSHGMSNQLVHIIFGNINDGEQAKFDTDEVEKIHWLSVAEVKALIMNKEIQDGVSLMSLLLYLNL